MGTSVSPYKLATLDGHDSSVFACAWSPDGTRLATASRDRTARVWDIFTRREVAKLEGHTDAVRTYAYSPGRDIYDGSYDPVPARLRTGHATGARAKACCLLIHAEASLSLSPRHHTHFEVCAVSQMTSYDITNTVHESLSPGGSRLATGSWDNTVRIW